MCSTNIIEVDLNGDENRKRGNFQKFLSERFGVVFPHEILLSDTRGTEYEFM